MQFRECRPPLGPECFVFLSDIHKQDTIYRRTAFAVFMGCELLCLTLTEEHRPRLFKNRGLGKILGPEREKVTSKLRKLHNGSFAIRAAHRILLESSYQWGWDGKEMWHVLGEEKCIPRCAGENFETWPFAWPRHKWEDYIKMDHK